MQIFSKGDSLYELQEAWNTLEPEEALTYSHYDLAKHTDFDEEQWREFLKDGQVAKFLQDELELFKEAQMRKLVKRATTNDKSVGTAQMLNAIGKSMEDDQAEQSFFIYSYVPPTPAEALAPLVREETDWQPNEEPEVIEAPDVEELKNKEDIVIEDLKEPSKEVEEDEWF